MLERTLRGLGGFMVILSLILAQTISKKWLILTGFAGLNLLQSAFTDWCPMMPVLRAMGIDKKGDKLL